MLPKELYEFIGDVLLLLSNLQLVGGNLHYISKKKVENIQGK